MKKILLFLVILSFFSCSTSSEQILNSISSGDISTKAHRLHLRTLIDNALKEIKG